MISSGLRKVIRINHLLNYKYIHTSSLSLVNFKKWYQNIWIPKRVDPPYTHITQVGDPVLRNKSEPVPLEYVKSDQVKYLIDQMVDALRNYDLVGIAAPQIGIGLRVIAMEFSEGLKSNYSPAVYEARQMSTLPLTVIINPVLTVTNYDKVKHPEGCASVKGYSAEVERYVAVRIEGLLQNGKTTSVDLKGWNARIAQHEMDHLDGRLYTDIMDSKTFTCSCWQAVNAREGRVEIRFTPK